jgi:hypothetical protein
MWEDPLAVGQLPLHHPLAQFDWFAVVMVSKSDDVPEQLSAIDRHKEPLGHRVPYFSARTCFSGRRNGISWLRFYSKGRIFHAIAIEIQLEVCCIREKVFRLNALVVLVILVFVHECLNVVSGSLPNPPV